jgi:2EXR family
MSSSNEFRSFHALPIELRLRIWDFTLAVPRSVNITADVDIPRRGVPRVAKSFHSTDRPPALLHVCQESRFEALKVYKPLFRTPLSPRYIYVAFAWDTIKANGTLIQYIGPAELQGIQKMVLDIKDPAYFAHFSIDVLKQMQPNLTEIELVLHQEEVWGWNEGQDYLRKVNGDFLDAIELDPKWHWPEIRIVEAKTGELFERIAGKAYTPAWKIGAGS